MLESPLGIKRGTGNPAAARSDAPSRRALAMKKAEKDKVVYGKIKGDSTQAAQKALPDTNASSSSRPNAFFVFSLRRIYFSVFRVVSVFSRSFCLAHVHTSAVRSLPSRLVFSGALLSPLAALCSFSRCQK